jgi:tetratricopeptide (TPR) repeat protein
METWIKLLLGLLFLLLSVGYLYRPAFVLSLNAWGRGVLFNDTFILLYRRRFGLFFLAAAVLFLYSGFLNLGRRPGALSSNYLALLDAQRAYRGGEHKGAVARCQEILKDDPDNLYAWALLGTAWNALGHPEQAARAWERVIELDPNHPAARRWLDKKNRP